MLAIVLIAEIMDLLDSTVITIAAPTVRHELGGGTTAMQWWAAGYTLAFAVFMIVGGRLGDVFGRRRVFVIGIAGFTLASIACALAPSPDVLIATRVLQGGFGALLIPQGLGMIKTVFPPKEMGGAFAAFGPIMGLAAIAGPILAGWLVSADLLGTGWRMIFLVNVPLGVVGLLGRAALHARVEVAHADQARPARRGPHQRRVAGPHLPAGPGPRARLAAVDLRPDGCRPRAARPSSPRSSAARASTR